MSRFNLFLTWIVYLFSVIETSIFLSTRHVTLGRKKLGSLRILFAFIYPCSDTTLDFYITRFSLSVTCVLHPHRCTAFVYCYARQLPPPLYDVLPLSASVSPLLRGPACGMESPHWPLYQSILVPLKYAFIGIVGTTKNLTGMEIFFLCWVRFDSQWMFKSGGEHRHSVRYGDQVLPIFPVNWSF